MDISSIYFAIVSIASIFIYYLLNHKFRIGYLALLSFGFIGSFNLEEPATLWEPQTLNPKIIEDNLLNHLEIKSYRISKQGPNRNEYAPFFKNELRYNEGEEGFLWVKGTKS